MPSPTVRPMVPYDLAWCLRRLPMPVFKLLQNNPNKIVLAGGFIRSCVANEPINDIDIFLMEAGKEQDEIKKAAKLLTTALSGQGWQYTEPKVVETANALTYLMKPYPVQIITRWPFMRPYEVLSSFDFTISQAAVYYGTDSAIPHSPARWRGIVTSEFYEDLAAKRLTYTVPNRNEDAGGSMLRVLKFYQRGYRIPLDSLGAVLARLQKGVDLDRINKYLPAEREAQMAKVLTGLLREVDPNVDPSHAAHLPASEAPIEPPEDGGAQSGRFEASAPNLSNPPRSEGET